MSALVAVLFTLLIAAESLWMFALSAHVNRITKFVAPAFLLVAFLVLWITHLRRRSVLLTAGVGGGLLALGFGIGVLAIMLA